MKKNIKNQNHKQQTPNLINYLNRIITTQTRLSDTDFKRDAFMDFALSQVLALTHASGVAIEVCEGNDSVFRYTSGSMEKFAGMKFDINNSIALLSMNTHQIICSNNAKMDTRFPFKSMKQIAFPLSIVTVPLFHEGKVMGALILVNEKIDQFDEINVQTARIFSGLIGYAISQHMYQEQNIVLMKQQTATLNHLRNTELELEHTMRHDYLTGLPNRQLFNDQLTVAIKKAKRRKQTLALLYMNIDHFKKVNEVFSNTIGDKILSAFVMRLKQTLRASDIVARVGGDEFVMLIDDIGDVQDVIVVIDKIMQNVRKPFQFNKRFIHVTVSIGVAFLKDYNISADQFLKQADQALYISKNSGRNTFYIFNSELQHETS